MNNDLANFKDLYFKTAHEYVNNLMSGLETLGPNPSSEKLGELHRFAHSLKSQSAVMQFMNISHLSGTLEQLFDQLQKGEQQLTPDMLAELNKSVDALSKALDTAEHSM
jgi:chemotaxis protein histidine kinase CheA